MTDLIREIDEELRREDAAKLWSKYGKYVIAAAVLLVVAVTGYQGWKAYDLSRRSGQSQAFSAALAEAEQGNRTAAIAALADIKDPGAAGYGGLAAFKEAELKLAEGDKAGAIAAWDALAGQTTMGQGYRDIAVLLSTLHQMDEGDPDALRSRLQPLTQPGRAFRTSAIELIALLHLQAGDTKAARLRYSEIADDATAPSGIRRRAAEMLQALGKDEDGGGN